MTVTNLASPEFQENLYESYADFRNSNEPALVQSVTGSGMAYLVTRYDDVMTVLKDPRFANDRRRLSGVDDWTKKWFIPKTIKRFGDTMALVDEPDHGRLRKLVHKAFTPKMIQDLENNIRQLTHELLDAAADKTEIDFMADFALPLPLNVICDMMGVEPEDRDNMHRWMGDTITNTAANSNLLSMLPKLMNTFGLERFLKKLVSDRRQHPKDDLTTALVHAEADGDKLTEDELLAMLFLILFAGHETTVNLIGSGTLALLQNPDQFELLKQNPDLLDSAIEELLRYTNPVQHIAPRYATETVEVGGITIPENSTVLVSVAAANRDETVFENPDQLDITRSPNRHVAFGFGLHYCLGAPLARLEAKVAFEILFERYPNLELAAPVNELEWRGAPALRGLKHFPMHLNG